MATDRELTACDTRAERRPGMSGRWRGFALLLLLLSGWLCMPTAHAASCGAATTQGDAPGDYQTYCWFDLTSYSDTTARGRNGQSFSFSLPDGDTLSFRLKVTRNTGGATPYFTATSAPSWSGAAFGQAGFINIPGEPVLYQASGNSGGNDTITISNIAITTPSGSPAGTTTYQFIVADAESTNNGESLKFQTNGGAWTQQAQLANGGSYPSLSGVGSGTVTETGASGTVGAYVFGSTNPTTVTATVVGSGLQGVAFGIRVVTLTVNATINGSRANASDQFTYSINTSTGTALDSKTSSGTGSGPFMAASASLTTLYPTVKEVMASGSAGTLGSYAESLTCTNAASGSTTTLPNNASTTSYAFPSVHYGDMISCTFTNTPLASVGGTVYGDANHNTHIDPGESGTGQALFVKLAVSSGGVCQAPASAVATVDTTTGTYTVPGVAPGTYCLILDNNATLSDTTPTLPTGWIGTEVPSGIRQVTVGSYAPPPQNFGLFHGATVSGVVFLDGGAGGGTANNGVKDGGEAGLASITVSAVSGGGTAAAATTDGAGNYTLWIPSTVTASTVVTPAAPNGYLATGGSAGTTGGTYTRPSVTFTPSSGLLGTGVNFGLVPSPSFAPDGTQSAEPGAVVFYPHTFIAGSGGQVTFGVTAVATPSMTGWVETLYQDTNCNGQLDSGEAQLGGAVTVTAGQSVCVLVKEFVPAAAPLNAQDKVTVSAAFTYTNASPVLSATLTRTDTTTVTLSGSVRLSKLVSNLTQGGAAGTTNNALPGDTLKYQLVVSNPDSKPIHQLLVNDTTPAFTAYVSAACPAAGSLPAGLTACSVSTHPAVGGQGAVAWTFTGNLAPGAQVTVTYQVTVSP